MEESAGVLCFGTNLARIKYLDQTSFRKQNLKLAQSRQKSYADNRRRELRF
jgi:hypothetical protein